MSRPAAPAFLLANEPRRRGFWEALAVVLGTDKPASPGGSRPAALFPEQTTSYWPHRNLVTSALLHLVAFFLMTTFPFQSLLSRPADKAPEEARYELKNLKVSLYLPTLRSPGPGGRPGRGTDPSKLPALGSTALHPQQTIVSNPLRPDNTRQTIIQPNSPPDLIIPYELKLPNVVLGSNLVPAPKLRKRNAENVALGRPSKVPPKRVTPVAPAAPPPDLVLAPTPPVNLYARMTLPSVPPPIGPGAAAGESSSGDAFNASLQWKAGEGPGLLVVGVEPGPPTDSLSIPPGNRYGDFSISPFGGQPGSPGGVPGGSLDGGSGGAGTGGDGSSTGVGPGNSGGGGGSQGAPGMLSISGGSEEAGSMMASASSPPSRVVYNTSLANTLVYPVGKLPRIRRGTLTVTTGPTGGGGLRVYGVLQGGKIYSVYVPMPGKSWVLQYCAANPGSPQAPRSRAVAAHLDHGLVPPSPREQFDFRRPPVPPDKADELIVLHGTIREDGSIGDLRVLRGVDPVADEAALAAFSQWKFDPALRDGKPVLLNILVGVPPTLPPVAGQQAEVPAAEKKASNP